MPKIAQPNDLDRPAWPFAGVTAMSANVANNQWVKKIRGRTYSFGVIWSIASGQRDPGSVAANAEVALKRYQTEGPSLHAGLPRDNVRRDGVTIGEMCGLYLQSRKADCDLGKLSPLSFKNYASTCKLLIATFGMKRPVEALKPIDFAKLLRSAPFGPSRLQAFVVWVKQVFAWAYDAEVIERPPKFGKAFKGSNPKERRQLRRKAGKNMLRPDQIRSLLGLASAQMRAMIMLAINGGLGNTDLARLPIAELDLDGAMLDFPRIKTSIERRVPLWPETVQSLREAIAVRPAPLDPDHAGLVFLTAQGRPWVRQSFQGGIDALGAEFQKLLVEIGAKKPKRKTDPAKKLQRGAGRRNINMPIGFYTLKRTFRTIADQVKDQHAAFLVTGHVIPGMAGVYVQEIELSRLKAVTDHVRAWLFETPWSCPLATSAPGAVALPAADGAVADASAPPPACPGCREHRAAKP